MRVALSVALLFLFGALSSAIRLDGPQRHQDRVLQDRDVPRRGDAPWTKPNVQHAGPRPAGPAVPAVPDAPAGGQEELDPSTVFSDLADYFSDPTAPITLDLIPSELRTPLEQLTPLTKCARPGQARVRQEPFNADKALPRDFLSAIIGKPERFAELETLVKHHSFTCIDSRHEGPTLGTPGGDFGEFLIALSVAEETLGHDFQDEEVFVLLRQFVTWNKRGNATFYFHTDEAAVDTLASHLHVNGMTRVVTDLNLENPPVAFRDEALTLLDDPVHQGSRVIKAFLQFPEKFRLRRGLTGSLLRAAHRLLWDRLDTARDGSLVYKRMNLEVLVGEPKPRAWLSIRSSQGCEVAGAAHAFSPVNAVDRTLIPQTADEKAKAAALAAAKASRPPVTAAERRRAHATKSFLETVSLSAAELAEMGLEPSNTPSFAEVLGGESAAPAAAPASPAAAAPAAAAPAVSFIEADVEVTHGPGPYGHGHGHHGHDLDHGHGRGPHGPGPHGPGPRMHGPFDDHIEDDLIDEEFDEEEEFRRRERRRRRMAAMRKGRFGKLSKDLIAARKAAETGDFDRNIAPAQTFVHHPDAVRDLRKWLSRFFALRFPHAASQPQFLQALTRRQQGVLEGVAEILGRDVPFYTITIE